MPKKIVCALFISSEYKEYPMMRCLKCPLNLHFFKNNDS